MPVLRRLSYVTKRRNKLRQSILLKRIVFTVTNDLSFDQRMQRICTSLSKAGYSVLLVGRKLNNSLPLRPELFQQKRFTCKFNTGMLFYAEYNLRLLYYLMTVHIDVICAIDLDTILPCYFVSLMRQKNACTMRMNYLPK